MPSIGLVLPTINERPNLEILLPTLSLPSLPSSSASPLTLVIIIVDDGSTDGTVAWARAQQLPWPITVIARNHPQGLASAYYAGFQWLLRHGVTWIAQMDADGSHRVQDWQAMASHLLTHPEVDVLIGSRYIPGGSTPEWPWTRRLVSRAGGFYSRALLHYPIADWTSGLKFWRASLLAQYPWHRLHSTGFGFQIEMTYWALQQRACVAEYPITFLPRHTGTSKFSFPIFWEAWQSVWRIAHEEAPPPLNTLASSRPPSPHS